MARKEGSIYQRAWLFVLVALLLGFSAGYLISNLSAGESGVATGEAYKIKMLTKELTETNARSNIEISTIDTKDKLTKEELAKFKQLQNDIPQANTAIIINCSETIIGDTDQNRRVTPKDARNIFWVALGYPNITILGNYTCCLDVDMDGSITKSDALAAFYIALGYNESPGHCPLCTDTDGGYNIYETGTVSVNGENYTDYCTVLDQYLKEYSCGPRDQIQFNYTLCPEGLSCVDGTCVARDCVDSDGWNPMTRGYVVYPRYEDYCIDNLNLKEYICSEGDIDNINLNCSSLRRRVGDVFVIAHGATEWGYGVFRLTNITNTTITLYDFRYGINITFMSSWRDGYGYGMITFMGYTYNFVVEYLDGEFMLTVTTGYFFTSCSEGTCIANEVFECDDTDGGINISEKGTAQWYPAPDEPTVSINYTDMCYSYNKVQEYYCDGSERVDYGLINCPAGEWCYNSSCLSISEILDIRRNIINSTFNITEYNVNEENNMLVFVVRRVIAPNGVFEMSDYAFNGTMRTLSTMANAYREWTDGGLDLNIGVVEIEELEIDSDYDAHFQGSQFPEYIVSVYATRNIDIYELISEGGGGHGGGVYYGAGIARAGVDDLAFMPEIYGTMQMYGDIVSEPVIHEPLHIVDYALYYVMYISDIYKELEKCINWETWDRCGNCEGECYPACGEGEEDTYLWFPSIDFCEWDPDWYDCNNEGEPHHCLKDERDPAYPEVGQTWYQHVLEDHFPRNITFIGNHCRDGIQDFGETSIDCGGPCEIFC